MRQVFKNKDDSTARLHLVCSDLEHDYDAIPLDLQKTVASGGVSQILEVQRQLGQVTHAHGAHAEQPCLYGHLRYLQAAMPEPSEQDQPVCAVSQVTDQCVSQRLCSAADAAGGCVTSLMGTSNNPSHSKRYFI